jgi:hypothetical protein
LQKVVVVGNRKTHPTLKLVVLVVEVYLKLLEINQHKTVINQTY